MKLAIMRPTNLLQVAKNYSDSKINHFLDIIYGPVSKNGLCLRQEEDLLS
jgi:hypothetical protein